MPDEPKDEAYEVPDSDITGMPEGDGGIGAEFDRILEQDGLKEAAPEQPTEEGTKDSEPSQEASAEGEESKAPDEAKGVETLEPTEDAERAAPTEGGFNFLDRDYANQEAAEHAFRSHMGSVSSLSKRTAELEELLRQSTDALERQGMMGGTPDPRQQSDVSTLTPKRATPKTEEAKGPPKWTDFYQSAVAEKIREDADYGDEGAEQYREQKMEEYHQARDSYGHDQLMSSIREENAPLRMQAEQLREVEEATTIFEGLAGRLAFEPEEGEEPVYLYPELREDQGFVESMAKRYRDAPGEKSQYGAHLAYLEERHFREITGGTSTQAKKPSETVVDADLSLEAKNRAALAAQSKSGNSTPNSRGNEGAQDRINREFSEDGRNMGEETVGIPGF